MIVKRGDLNGRLQTYSGRYVWPLDPRVEDIELEDIAHALSNICRYGGHVKKFYSVAEHSIYVSEHSKSKDALTGLLHDASEAYMVDLPRPIKNFMPNYRDLEENVQRVVAEKFGLRWPFPASVHTADNRILVSEMRDLMVNIPEWPGRPRPYDTVIKGLSPKQAEKAFLNRYKELTS